MDAIFKLLAALDRAFARTVETFLVVILLVMVALGASQVVLRDLFSGGFSWSDVAARNMVLWVAFLGAILATRKRQHIAIDVITRFIPDAPRNFVRIFLDAFSAAVTFYLARASYAFVLSEKEFGGVAFANVPTWVVQVIIPIGFIIISAEFLIGIVLDIYRLLNPSSTEVSS